MSGICLVPRCPARAGVVEAGWRPEDEPAPPYRLLLDGRPGPQRPDAANVRAFMGAALAAVRGHEEAWPFQEPVPKAEVPDYYDIIRVGFGTCAPCRPLRRGYSHKRVFLIGSCLWGCKFAAALARSFWSSVE